MALSPETIDLILTVLIWTGGIAAVLCLIALYAEELREMISYFCGIIYVPISFIVQRFNQYMGIIASWIRHQIYLESPDRSSDNFIYYVAGSFIYAAIGCLMLYSDASLLMLSFPGLGIPVDIKAVKIIDDDNAGMYLALAIISSLVVWPMLLIDSIGLTHLAPWVQKLQGLSKKIFQYGCVFFFILTVVVFLTFGYWRADIVNHLPIKKAFAATAVDNSEDISISPFQIDEDNLDDGKRDAEQVHHPRAWISYVILLGFIIPVSFGGAVSIASSVSLIKWIILCAGLILCFPFGVISFVLDFFLQLIDIRVPLKNHQKMD